MNCKWSVKGLTGPRHGTSRYSYMEFTLEIKLSDWLIWPRLLDLQGSGIVFGLENRTNKNPFRNVAAVVGIYFVLCELSWAFFTIVRDFDE
jgi:hypothetical protein